MAITPQSTTRTCSVTGCERPSRKRGWCILHYRRWRTHADPYWIPITYRVSGLVCRAEGCARPVLARELCKKHYSRWYRKGTIVRSWDIPFVDRFWGMVDRSGGPAACWNWQGSLTQAGYGIIGFVEHIHEPSHRIAYALTYGSIPPDLFVCHHCDNPPCCNPQHLFVGTHADNMRDMVQKGRAASGSRNGHVTRPHSYAHMRGENIHTAKLTSEQVIAIRRRYANGDIRQVDLAREYGVGQAVISAIIRCTSWTHIMRAPDPTIVAV